MHLSVGNQDFGSIRYDVSESRLQSTSLPHLRSIESSVQIISPGSETISDDFVPRSQAQEYAKQIPVSILVMKPLSELTYQTIVASGHLTR